MKNVALSRHGLCTCALGNMDYGVQGSNIHDDEILTTQRRSPEEQINKMERGHKIVYQIII